MLNLDNIVLSRGNKKILNGLNAEAARGQFITLVGNNGTGKTTLFNFIAGLLESDSGSIIYNKDLINPESAEWNEKLSYVLDDGGTIPLLTVNEQLRLQCLLNGIEKTEASERAEQIIKLLNLTKHRDYRAEELSAGLRKKLGIGLGLIREADIYIFDEPFSSLDVFSASVLKILLSLLKQRGRTVILSTHSPAYVSGLFDRIWMLSDGKIIDYHEPSELKQFMEEPEEEETLRFHNELPWVGRSE